MVRNAEEEDQEAVRSAEEEDQEVAENNSAPVDKPVVGTVVVEKQSAGSLEMAVQVMLSAAFADTVDHALEGDSLAVGCIGLAADIVWAVHVRISAAGVLDDRRPSSLVDLLARSTSLVAAVVGCWYCYTLLQRRRH